MIHLFLLLIIASLVIADDNNNGIHRSKYVDVIVKVANQEGSNYAKGLAKKIKIINLNYLGLTVSHEVLLLIERNKNIESVDLDNKVFSSYSSHPIFGEETIPWGIKSVLQDVEWWNTLDKNNSQAIKVCVADTGYDISHEDLPKDNVNGTDGYDESWSVDGDGHGTHTSGTVAALGGNNIGVYGVLPNDEDGLFQLIIGKALNSDGTGSGSGVMSAVQGCVDLGADVVSMSLGCNNCYTKTEDDFYSSMYESGVLLVAAAGNSGNSDFSYPASYSSVISVAALNSSNKVAYFSQYNAQVEISAPGVDVYSTIPGNEYANYSGTSMATPHVSAVAGLIWMYFPECTNKQIRHVLAKTAMPLASAKNGCDEHSGFGLVQAQDAYDILSDGNCGGNDIGSNTPIGGCCEATSSSEACVEVLIKTSVNGTNVFWNITDANATQLMTGGHYTRPNSYTESNPLYIDEFYYFDLYVGAGDLYGSYKIAVGNGVLLYGDLTSSKSITFYLNAQEDLDDLILEKG